MRKKGEIPIYASTGVTGWHNEAKVKGPGIVTGRSGSLGMVSYAPSDFWPLNTALWVREFRRVGPLFAYFMLQKMRLEQYNGGASVPTLDRNAVHRVNVTVPSRQLLGLFDEYAKPAFLQKTLLEAQNGKFAAARDHLLPKLMSGEIAA
ncbi:MAG: hypothetical protein HN341_18930 [Verrucomicrobia bacterium]|nr:hypothetical protein [Verrucomicrobiota bacterium]